MQSKYVPHHVHNKVKLVILIPEDFIPGRVCIYVKETMHVNMRADLMFENTEAIWVEIQQGDTKYLVSCINRRPSATAVYHGKIVDMLECARVTEHPVISLGNL